MKIVSKLRLILIPLFLLIVVGLGNVPFSVYIQNIGELRIYKNDGDIFWPTQIFAVGILALIFFLIYRIVTRTLILYIDTDLKTITFFYPFKRSKKQYPFNEIKTFSLSYWHSRVCDFKCLNFQTNDKIYRFSDFEISNFRIIERVVIENFTLSLGKKFELIAEDLKQEEIQNNIKFDIDQAKSYRISCYMFLSLAIFIIASDSFGPATNQKIGLFGISLCICLAVFTICKILQANRTIKNFS